MFLNIDQHFFTGIYFSFLLAATPVGKECQNSIHIWEQNHLQIPEKINVCSISAYPKTYLSSFTYVEWTVIKKTFSFQLSLQLMYKSEVAQFSAFWLLPSWNHNYLSMYLDLQRLWLSSSYVQFVFSCFAARPRICLYRTPSFVPLFVMMWNVTITRCCVM